MALPSSQQVYNFITGKSNKSDVPQLGQPVLKSSEVTSTTPSNVQVVSTTGGLLDQVPKGSVSTGNSGGGGGGYYTPPAPTLLSTTTPTTVEGFSGSTTSQSTGLTTLELQGGGYYTPQIAQPLTSGLIVEEYNVKENPVIFKDKSLTVREILPEEKVGETGYIGGKEVYKTFEKGGESYVNIPQEVKKATLTYPSGKTEVTPEGITQYKAVQVPSYNQSVMIDVGANGLPTMGVKQFNKGTSIKDYTGQQLINYNPQITTKETIQSIVEIPSFTFDVVTNVAGKVTRTAFEKGTEVYFDIVGEKTINPRYYGEKIGNVLREPSIVLDYFKGKPDVVYDLNSNVARLSTEIDFKKQPLIYRTQERNILYKDSTIKAMGDIGEFGGKVGAGIGIYFSPVGNVVFASQVEKTLRPYDYNIINYAKAEPVEAGLLGGTLVGVGALKTAKWYNTPKIIQEGSDLVIGTRGAMSPYNILGMRLVVPTKLGELSKKYYGFDLLENAGKLRIKSQPLGAGQLPESLQPIPPKVISLSDEATIKILDKYITPIKDTKGVARFVLEGEKKIVTEPVLNIFGGVKREDIISHGLSPYTKEGKIERANVLSELKDLGIERDVGKKLIALKYPKIIKYESDITGMFIESEKGVRLSLTEKQVKIKEVGKFNDMFGSISSRGGKKIESTIDVDLEPSGKSLKSGEDILRGTGLKETPSKQLGKRTETFSISATAKKTGEQEMALFKTEIEGIGTVAKTDMFEFYKSIEVSKKIIPRKMEIEFSAGDLIIKQPTEREVIDLNERLGISDIKSNFIQGSGKRSSSQYFKELYSNTFATGLGVLKDIKRPMVKMPKVDNKPVLTRELPSMVGGQGLKLIPFTGQGLYERTESFGAIPSKSILGTTEKTFTGDLNIKTNNQFENLDLKLGIKDKIKFEEKLLFATKIDSRLREDIMTRFAIDQLSKQRQMQQMRIEEPILIKKFAVIQTQQKQMQRQKQMHIQEPALRMKFKPTTIKTKIPKPKIDIGFNFRKQSGRLKTEQEFGLFIKRKGKFQPVLSGTRGRVLRSGEDIVMKELSRTFEVRPTGRTVDIFNMDEGYMPQETLFRGYKVRKGKQIPLVNTFIQRTGALLQTPEEKRMIKFARIGGIE